MNVALVGHPLSGKSTLFSALTGVPLGHTTAYSDKGRLGAVKVPDARLDWLGELTKAKKITHASLEFTDLAGLSFLTAADQQQSLRLIATIRQADMLVLILRTFDNPAVPAYRDRIDPAADFAELHSEFIFADLEQVSNRIEKLQKQIAKPTPDREHHKQELALLERGRATLEAERPLAEIIHTPDEAKLVSSFGFLTEKPLAVVVNVSENQRQNPPAISADTSIPQLAFCAELEYELVQLSQPERGEFMAEMAVESLATERLIHCCCERLGLISFLTYTHDECRAWSIPANTPAIAAAGEIHSDIARGFIRAEVVAFEDLKAAGDFKQAKAAGKVRLESKQYLVQDGDVITFRFNV